LGIKIIVLIVATKAAILAASDAVGHHTGLDSPSGSSIISIFLGVSTIISMASVVSVAFWITGVCGWVFIFELQSISVSSAIFDGDSGDDGDDDDDDDYSGL
jgi:hypothetical protein